MSARAPRAGLKLVEREKEVEASLWRRLRFDNEARCREALFDRHRRMARAVAFHEFRRRPPYGLERNDFEQLAYSGLLEAIDRFDPLRGAPFEAFARLRIRGAIADGLARSNESGAQYSHRRRTELERLRSLRVESDAGGLDPVSELSDLAVALAIGIMAETATLGGDETASSSGLDAYESLSWRELQLSILKEIEQLPGSEKSVMQQHYLSGVSFTQIAALLGVTKGRVSQLHRAAIHRVRDRLHVS
jgi:RNA polymerase sigma factor for flagellar operon FliA